MTMIDPRERLTEGVTRERLKMEGKRSIKPTLFFGLGLLVALLIGAFLITRISETFGHKTRTVRFAAPTAFGIFEGFDDVRYRGVPAGTITKIERRGTQIVLVAKIRNEFGPVFKDARVELRPITPLNDEYLDIVDQGTERAGPADPDVPLPQSQMKTSVSVPEVFDTFKSDERKAFNVLLDQLGNGAADRGEALRAAFVQLVPFLEGAGKLTQQIALRRTATKRLIHNTSILTDELGNRETALRRLVKSGAATLGTLQQGSSDLDQTLKELGPTFTELRSSLASVRGVLGDVDTGLRSLNPVADELPGGLTALRKLNRDLVPTLRSLRTGVPPMTEFVVSLTKVFRNLTGASQALRPQVPVVNKVTRDLVTCERGVIGFMHWNASLTKFGDYIAPVPRGNLAIGVPSISSRSPLREPHKGCTPGTPERGVITAAGER